MFDDYDKSKMRDLRVGNNCNKCTMDLGEYKMLIRTKYINAQLCKPCAVTFEVIHCNLLTGVIRDFIEHTSDKIASEPYEVIEKTGKHGSTYIDDHDPYDTERENPFTITPTTKPKDNHSFYIVIK